jgi:primosomal protein N' (replication factor Y)
MFSCADIILPLAIPGTFTYLLPEFSEFPVQPGVRVVVPVGRKLHTGIVRKLLVEKPEGIQLKPIDAVLDDFPIVNEHQFKLWEWMAEYYMCHIGEVMSSALPGSLKLSSESKLILEENYKGDGTELDGRELLVFEALRDNGTLSFTDISRMLGIKSIQTIVKSLVDKGVVIPEEELKYRYKARYQDIVKAGGVLSDEIETHALFDKLQKKSPKQLKALMTFISLAANGDNTYSSVPRLLLQKQSGLDASVIKALADKDVLVIEKIEVDRITYEGDQSEVLHELSEEQANALVEIKANWKEKDINLLYGITGSGKTEVYIHLIEEQIKLGKQVLYLLPEIALTSQIIRRLQKHFGSLVGVYHSRFNLNERAEIWRRVRSTGDDAFRVILGARSSLFLPYADLGLIVVDEEHETTFKQQDPAPRYHARDTAVMMASLYKAKVLLGSGTPSIETYWNAKRGQYGLIELTGRYGSAKLPEILCADLRQERKDKSMKGLFSLFLIEKMKETLEAGDQIILFQNRRGYAPMWQCNACGWSPECPRCDVSLTYHKHLHRLRCHYCGYESQPQSQCPACTSQDIRTLGFGTEKIEEELGLLFPEFPSSRMDLDTTRSRNAYHQLISDFESGNSRILVGTQMVTKGLDFDNVGLVGILNADMMLKFPDFRSHERAFHLMSQVAGRAGRREKPGKVVIQSYKPDHWVIRKVMEHDFKALYAVEIADRERFAYPPFYRLIAFSVRHKENDKAHQASVLLANGLKQHFGDRVLGPEAPYVSRINNIYLMNVMLKFERSASPYKVKLKVAEVIKSVMQEGELGGLRVVVDVDPY